MATGGGPTHVSAALDSTRQEEIRGQLARLLATAAFASALRRGQLLRYLVERTLAGEGDGINEYGIGLDVFEKPASFDPRIESIVRNEAGRLRQKLRDYYAEIGSQDRVLIELPPRGYKPAFVFREAETPPISPPAGDQPTQVTKMSMPGRWLRILLSGLLVAALVELWLNRGSIWPASLPDSQPIRALAVLPLQNLSNDPSQEYFTDGMTDELITDLAQLHELKVVSKTSIMQYKGVRKSLPQIGRELGVDAVVEGSVLRSGNRMRITAQLIQAATDRHLWAHSFEGDLRDILTLQAQVAEAITGAVKLNLTAAERRRFRSARPTDPDAYDAYLRGRYHLNRRDAEGFEQAIGYFNQSLEKNPNFALAYAGLSDCYTLLSFEGGTPEAAAKARTAALKAVALDDNSAEPHTSLAGIDVFRWNWLDAEREFQRALALNPNYALAHHWHGNLYLSPLGRHAEAIAELKRAQELDPLSLIVQTDLGFAYFFAGQYDAAFSQYQKVLAANPSFSPVHWVLGNYYFEREMYGPAMEELAQLLSHNGDSEMARKIRASYTAGGPREFLRFIANAKGANGRHYFGFEYIAKAYMHLGQKKAALAALEQDFRLHDADLIRLNADPSWNRLRAEPEFQEIVRRIGLR
ncbi:MAG: tetratricopeptide repeat protein [Bryobacteraceae bacterium]|jgi:TolB-like protein